MRQAPIDGGKPFDWNRAATDYAAWRDIYPPDFYQKLLDAGFCGSGARVLDLGTGTGVLPRALYPHGARFTGIDASPRQIEEAKRLAAASGKDIDFRVMKAEALEFPPASFEEATACQCFFYFEAGEVLRRLSRILCPGGRLALLYMAWLPEEDPIAGASEELILRYNPGWSGARERRRPIPVPPEAAGLFTCEQSLVWDLAVPFTRESWRGRIRACRGVGASLSGDEVRRFDAEHAALLANCAPEAFTVAHYAAMTVLRRL